MQGKGRHEYSHSPPSPASTSSGGGYTCCGCLPLPSCLTSAADKQTFGGGVRRSSSRSCQDSAWCTGNSGDYATPQSPFLPLHVSTSMHTTHTAMTSDSNLHTVGEDGYSPLSYMNSTHVRTWVNFYIVLVH